MPKHPEDLYFFKDDEVLLATSSHEEWCVIYPRNAEEKERIMNIKGIVATIEEDE